MDFSQYYHEILEFAQEDSFMVYDRVKNDFDFPIHYHKEMELNLIINGKGVKRVVGDHVSEIEELELVLVGPNVIHGWDLHQCQEEEIHEITIQFHSNLFSNELLNKRMMYKISDMFKRANHGISFSWETIQKLIPEFLGLSLSESVNSYLQLLKILNQLAESPQQEMLSSFSPLEKEHPNDDRMSVVQAYVEKNYPNKITLDEVSELLSMSQATFNRFIKNKTQKTFINYLNDVRVAFASRMLIESDDNIAEIAYLTGFNNISNFNRIFKSIKGYTPSDYRSEFFGLKKFK